MGFLSALFGGSRKESILTPGQAQLLGNVTGKLNEEWGQAGDVYQGQRVAGTNPLLQNVFSQAAGRAAQAPGMDAAMASALSGGGDPEGVQAAFQSALAPAREEFRRTLQDVGQQYGSTWGRSGALGEMTGRATADYGNNLTNLLGNLTYQDRQAGLDRQLQAIPAVAGAQGQQMNNLQSLFGLGQSQRGIEQQNLMGDLSQWQEGQWYNNPALQFMGPALGTQANAITQQQGILPGIGNMIGGAGQLAGGLSGMFGG